MISVNIHSSFKCEAEKSTGAVADHLHTLTTAIRRALFPGLAALYHPQVQHFQNLWVSLR